MITVRKGGSVLDVDNARKRVIFQSRSTVSGWLSGKARPETKNLTALCRYFGLPAGTDLEAEPLFLSPLPLGESQRKRWLHERIDQMDAAALQDIFSLLASMLAER